MCSWCSLTVGLAWVSHVPYLHTPVVKSPLLRPPSAVEKEWEKLEKIPAWQITKVRNKKEVIDEARNKGRKVHFCVIDGIYVILRIRSCLTTKKRREDLDKHNVHTHFPKDRNCEICKRTKITRAPCRRRNGEAVPRAVNFGDLITADHKVLSDNCESRNNHRYAGRGAGSSHPMDPGVSVQKQKLHKKPREACKSSWNPRGNQKSFTLTIPWNSAKLVKIFPGIIARLHHTDRETDGIAERAVRGVKEGTSAVLLQSGLNESWWADSMECYTYLRKRDRSII